MNRVLKIFILIIILAAVAAGAWVWFSNKSIPIIINTPVDNVPITNTPLDITPPADTNPVVVSAEQQIKSLARLFAATYGSYSTDAQFQNLKELNYIYTPSFAAYINQYISQTPAPAGYYSVNTRALAAEVVAFTDVNATVTIQTQREEVFSLGGESQLSYQTLRLQFNKISGEWKVDNAVWE